jgi:hypothetical protein
MLVHNVLYHSNLLPDVFSDCLTLNSSVYDFETRSKSDIHIYRMDTTFGRRSVVYEGDTFWNNLPPDLKMIGSASQFKSRLKHPLRGL